MSIMVGRRRFAFVVDERSWGSFGGVGLLEVFGRSFGLQWTLEPPQ
jgi:hypothetical protein